MEILHKYFPSLSSLQREQYQELYDQIIYWNRKINLVSRKDIEYLPERHILHSLGIAKFAEFKPGNTVLDVGTGGGLPGLPLAIMFPQTSFTLIDSIGKKINVVKEISASMKLQNVRCFQVRAEDYRGKTQMVVSRAVTRLDRFSGWVKKTIVKTPGKGIRNGIWYLKGGDLQEELRPFRWTKVYLLSDVFSEPFFESKKLVWLPLKSL